MEHVNEEDDDADDGSLVSGLLGGITAQLKA